MQYGTTVQNVVRREGGPTLVSALDAVAAG